MAVVNDINAGADAGAADVDVCICTYRRPSVADTIASIAAQVLPDGLRVRVIVADNDIDPAARETVVHAFQRHGLNGVYVHAPAQNISVARNACLDAVTAPLAGFIDDDEIARPDWLATIMKAMADTQADVMFGQVKAGYAADAPSWMSKADLHSTRAVYRKGVVDTGYTCNALFRTETIRDLRFDPALGRSGGEDTTFFNALFTRGARLGYAPEAVIDEPVPPSRSSLNWLLKRSFRNGQTHGYMMLRNGQGRAKIIGLAILKLIFCFAASVATVFSAARWRKSAVRGALHAGVIGAAFGKSPLELYR